MAVGREVRQVLWHR